MSAPNKVGRISVTLKADTGYIIRVKLGGNTTTQLGVGDFVMTLTAVQWKALLDAVGVNGSNAAGTAGLETDMGAALVSGGSVSPELALA